MPAKFVKSIGRTLDARPDRLDLRDREYTPGVISLPEQWPDDATIRRLLPDYCKAGLVLDQALRGRLHRLRSRLRHQLSALAQFASRTAHDASVRLPSAPACSTTSRASTMNGPVRTTTARAAAARSRPGTSTACAASGIGRIATSRTEVRFVSPKAGWAEDALQRRLGVYYRVNRASVVDMQAAIREIGAIYVSSDVHDGWGIEVRKQGITGHDSLPAVKPDPQTGIARRACVRTGGLQSRRLRDPELLG